MQTTEAKPVRCQDYFEGISPRLLEVLSEGMHSMAQPLTVLRATLEIAAGNACCISHYQQAIDSSLIEVSRVVDTMRFVQELVRIARDVPAPMPVKLGTVLSLVREDLKCVLEEAGISLQVRVTEELPAVLISAATLRQCLFYLVHGAQCAAVAGGTIEVGAHAAGEKVRIVVRSVGDHPVSLQSPAHPSGSPVSEIRSMTLVEALAVSQRGTLQWQDRPFVASLFLPAAGSLPGRRENYGNGD